MFFQVISFFPLFPLILVPLLFLSTHLFLSSSSSSAAAAPLVWGETNGAWERRRLQQHTRCRGKRRKRDDEWVTFWRGKLLKRGKKKQGQCRIEKEGKKEMTWKNILCNFFFVLLFRSLSLFHSHRLLLCLFCSSLCFHISLSSRFSPLLPFLLPPSLFSTSFHLFPSLL